MRALLTDGSPARTFMAVALAAALCSAPGLATEVTRGAPAVVFVHVALRSSSPAAGDSLAAPPRVLRLDFTEPVEVALSRVELVGPDSADVTLSVVRATDSTARSIAADVIGTMAAGTYRVRWSVVSRDGHPVRGEVPFTVMAAPVEVAIDTTALAPDTEASPAPDESEFDAQSPGYVAIRWLTYLGLLGVIGAVAFRTVVLERVRRRTSVESDAGTLIARALVLSRGWATAAVGLLLIAAVLRLAAQMRAVYGDVPFDASLARALIGGTAWGVGWMGQVGGALAALAIVTRPGVQGVAANSIATLALLVLAVSAAISGHPAAAYPVGMAISADAFHVLAAGGWVGSLALIAIAGIPATRQLAARAAGVRELVLAFSPLALVCASVLALTGAVSAWLELGSVGALWSTPYGITLLIKLGLVALILAAGAYNWRVATPRLLESGGVGGMRRAIAIEITLAAAVLAATAVLVATPPPVDTVMDAGEARWTVSAVDQRLRGAGIQARQLPPAASHIFMSVPATSFELARGDELEVFIYRDSAARAADTDALDPRRVAPPDMMIKRRAQPSLITDGNMAAIILTNDPEVRQRVRDALLLEPPPR